jgi:hypothetical protein
MSWSAELRAALLAALFAVPGCYEAHPCGAPEACNLRDDDCDGTVDEGFVDDAGLYTAIEACGSCGVDCRAVFPTAAEVGCVIADEGPVCRLLRCPEGFHRAGDGACVPDVNVLCLPCEEDADCALRLPGAACLETASGARRCGQPCEASAPCPEGFACAPRMEGPAQCVPSSGLCGCTDATAGTELACLLESPIPGVRCAGVQRCDEGGPSACEPALGEGCNLQDDDCDGRIDEDFVDDAGRYVSRYHCGACAQPCTEPGPNMVAACAAGADVTCEIGCAEGFVDVDRILANGCECERWDGTGPPPVVGGDADCDGLPDDTTDFVYVTSAGSDTNPGTLARPMRTIDAASARARAEGKDVLVARGIYEGPVNLVAGVSLYGGYSPDFADRDLELFPVLIERAEAPGQPAFVCRGITAATEVEGFVIAGSDAAREGEGSTAVALDGCGPAVVLRAIEVLAGRGGDGVRGDDASVNLAEWGFASLDELDGTSGAPGTDGTPSDLACPPIAGGAGSTHLCGRGRTLDVSGGAGGGAACPGRICTNGAPCGNAGCTDFTVGGVCDLDAARRAATPNPAAGAGRGPSAGAAGELTYNAPTNRGVCNFCDDNPTLPREGQAGRDGGSGIDGAGGRGCGLGPTISGDGVIAAGDGASGTPGSDGSGGGGGTAGGGYEVIGGTAGECGDRAGGSGGGGGSGGCGAPGADGGTGGGYAIGVFVRVDPATGRGPTFEDVRIVTASGGDGGDGGVGADGGAGGIGAPGGVGRFWCARTGGRGGDGGRGGAGGGGGGGCGGGSHGVYLAGGPETYRDEVAASVTVEATGVAGRAGRGGFSPGASGTDGSPGSAAAVVSASP